MTLSCTFAIDCIIKPRLLLYSSKIPINRCVNLIYIYRNSSAETMRQLTPVGAAQIPVNDAVYRTGYNYTRSIFVTYTWFPKIKDKLQCDRIVLLTQSGDGFLFHINAFSTSMMHYLTSLSDNVQNVSIHIMLVLTRPDQIINIFPAIC